MIDGKQIQYNTIQTTRCSFFDFKNAQLLDILQLPNFCHEKFLKSL